MKVPGWLVSGEGSLLGSPKTAFSLCPSMVKGEKPNPLASLLMRALISWDQGPTPNQVESNRQEALKDREVNAACFSGGDDTKGPDLHSQFSIWLLYIIFT